MEPGDYPSMGPGLRFLGRCVSGLKIKVAHPVNTLDSKNLHPLNISSFTYWDIDLMITLKQDPTRSLTKTGADWPVSLSHVN